MALTLNIDQTVTIATQTAAVALFDPLMIEHRRDAHRGWWQQNLDQIPEVNRGELAIIKLRHSSSYTLRVTSQGLTPTETERVISMIDLGLSVKSGRTLVAAAELLPGNEKIPSDEFDDRLGRYIDLPNGEYNLSIYAVSRNTVGDSDDIIIVVRERLHQFPGIEGATELFTDAQTTQGKQVKFDDIDAFSEYERRHAERNGQEKIGNNASKLRNPADYLAQQGDNMGQLFKAHIKFMNQPAGDFKQPNQLNINEALENAELAQELAASPKLEAALAAQATSTPTPSAGH
ncbi:MAG: hypothetical protein K0U12_02945 [Gammaproteobacteria bacterium]|nr:hypothetical protein [Gammaproteobacteria bacterium]